MPYVKKIRMIKQIFKILLWLFVFASLTALTQIGGIVFILSLIINRLWRHPFIFKPVVSFFGLYLISTFLIVPIIAPLFGREKVEHTDYIKPTTFMTDFLNRNYVRPDLNKLLKETENSLHGTNVKIIYLDANFPFINKFPLLPHLSHNEGKKIDFGLIYQDKYGKITDKQKSLSGYGVFENPKNGESNQIKKCLKNGYFQYDYTKYFSFGLINKDLEFSESGTKTLVESILKSNSIDKIFIEPHLKERLNLTDTRIRYHGCKSVRHDDHIHVQLK